MSSIQEPLSFDPNRPDFAPYGLTCVHWRPSPMRRPDHHNEIELNFIESGAVTYLLGGTKTKIEAGKLSAFWASIPHQIIDFGENTSYFVATIPLQCFLQWRLPETFVQMLMQGKLIGEPAQESTGSDSQLFAKWEGDLALKSPGLEQPVLLEMQARLIRLALKLPVVPGQRDKRDLITTIPSVGLNKVEQMACFIAQNYTSKLTVQKIGEFVNLHPNYAMGLFQKTFGTTLVNYLTEHRISHAKRLLATTDQTVTEVAFESGFLSISRFNSAFRQSCGCSPREYRKQHKLEWTAG